MAAALGGTTTTKLFISMYAHRPVVLLLLPLLGLFALLLFSAAFPNPGCHAAPAVLSEVLPSVCGSSRYAEQLHKTQSYR
jgi:hypothetical protein